MHIIQFRPGLKILGVGTGLKCVFLAGIALNALSAQTDSPAEQLREKELEFSRCAEVKGIRSAFLEYFDDACIVFAPQPTNGKAAYAANSDSGSSLVWAPTVVELSSSGDFGYTTGPSEYREKKLPADSAYCGHFFSVWKKDRVGQWKVILDIGIGYPRKEKREEALRLRQLPSNSRNVEMPRAAGSSPWLEADSNYSAIVQDEGSIVGLERYGTEEIRVYRKGKFPAEGLDAASRLVRDEKYSMFKFTAGQISSAGDLGYSYGLAVTSTADTSNYIRVWKRYDEWKLVADIVKPWGRKK